MSLDPVQIADTRAWLIREGQVGDGESPLVVGDIAG
jgi:hypothetical protein